MPSESIKILLVEDNLGDARLLYEGLEEALPEQFQMTHVRRLSEALEYLWEETCSVVLLDLGLPDSHGLDTLVVTRAQAPSVPIVVLTGFQDEAMALEALKGGAQDYLVKGQVESKLLGRAVRYAIVRKATEEALLRQGAALARVEELQQSRQRLLAAQERVRQDVAAHLREGVQRDLLKLREKLEVLLKRPSSEQGSSWLLNEVIGGLDQVTAREVGVLSQRLHPSTLKLGLVATFLSFRDQFEGGPAVAVELDEELARLEEADPKSVPEQVKLAAYRIAEEALRNAVKHANAGKITVRLEASLEGWLRLTVRDDGRGFDAETGSHGPGIATMRDYADAAGGECQVHSDPGKGTVVTAVLPVSRSGQEHAQGSPSRKEGADGETNRGLSLVP